MRAYFSIPVLKKDRNKYYCDASNRLKELCPNADTHYWVKDTQYYPEFVSGTDAFIFTTVDNSFNFMLGELPIGVLKELDKARTLNKMIYLAYTNSEGQINFYHVSIQNNICRGVSGSTGCISKELKNKKTLNHQNETDKSDNFDPRLLLN